MIPQLPRLRAAMLALFVLLSLQTIALPSGKKDDNPEKVSKVGQYNGYSEPEFLAIAAWRLKTVGWCRWYALCFLLEGCAFLRFDRQNHEYDSKYRNEAKASTQNELQ